MTSKLIIYIRDNENGEKEVEICKEFHCRSTTHIFESYTIKASATLNASHCKDVLMRLDEQLMRSIREVLAQFNITTD